MTAGMTTREAMWQLARYKPWTYLLNFALWILFYMIPLATGLVTKAFFDVLSGGEHAGFGIWGVIALLAGVSLARMFVLFTALVSWSDFWLTIEALLRR